MVASYSKYISNIILKLDKVCDKSKEKRFEIKFIGDNTLATVLKDKICSFEEGILHGFSNIKKKNLLTAYEDAKKMYEKKNGKAIKLDKISKYSNKEEESKSSFREPEAPLSLKEEKIVKPKPKTQRENIKEKEKEKKEEKEEDERRIGSLRNRKDMLHGKRKRENSIQLDENCLIWKIAKYLKYVTQHVNPKTELSERETLDKIVSYLTSKEIENPIETLKVSLLYIQYH